MVHFSLLLSGLDAQPLRVPAWRRTVVGKLLWWPKGGADARTPAATSRAATATTRARSRARAGSIAEAGSTTEADSSAG